MKAFWISFIIIANISSASCTSLRESYPSVDIGPIAIGSVPNEALHLQSTDCVRYGSAAFQDCAAIGDDGLRYVFFDGVLSKVVARKDEVTSFVRLPAEVRFNDGIEDARRDIERRFGVEFTCVDRMKERTCASDFLFRSTKGVLYSLELDADKDGRLVKIVARTDY